MSYRGSEMAASPVSLNLQDTGSGEEQRSVRPLLPGYSNRSKVNHLRSINVYIYMFIVNSGRALYDPSVVIGRPLPWEW
jgi:hypothetical protein